MQNYEINFPSSCLADNEFCLISKHINKADFQVEIQIPTSGLEIKLNFRQ